MVFEMRHSVLGILLMFSVVISALKFKLGNAIWRFIGKVSYELYLLHGLAYVGWRDYISNDLLFCVAVLVSSIMAAALLYYIDKFAIETSMLLTDRVIIKISGR